MNTRGFQSHSTGAPEGAFSEFDYVFDEMGIYLRKE